MNRNESRQPEILCAVAGYHNIEQYFILEFQEPGKLSGAAFPVRLIRAFRVRKQERAVQVTDYIESRIEKLIQGGVLKTRYVSGRYCDFEILKLTAISE